MTKLVSADPIGGGAFDCSHMTQRGNVIMIMMIMVMVMILVMVMVMVYHGGIFGYDDDDNNNNGWICSWLRLQASQETMTKPTLWHNVKRWVIIIMVVIVWVMMSTV